MACCYIAASMIAFIIRSCDALDINLHLQYNESVQHAYEDDELNMLHEKRRDTVEESGVKIVSISGMTCSACTTTVESALRQLKGVDEVLVSLPYQEARVFHNKDLKLEEVIPAIEAVGYDACIGERANDQKIQTLMHTKELETLRYSLQGFSVCSAVVFTLGTLADYSGYSEFLGIPAVSFARSILLFVLTTFAAVRYGDWIFQNAASAAARLQVNMHTLISASTFVGLSLTLLNKFRKNPRSDAVYYDTIVGVLLIITVGRYLDLLSRRRASDTFVGLYTLMDQTSTAYLTQLDKRVPTSIVRSGDEIMIDPFTVIPVDCYVVSGTSHINEAVITGEPLPKTKTKGDLLLAGTRNGANSMTAMVHQDYQGSFLSQLIRSVEGSLSSKASTQHRVDVITQYFVTMIFAIAVPTAVFTFISAGRNGIDFLDSVDAAGRKMMTVLAAACPCALGLATPCAVMAGIDVAWRRGLLMLQGGETMERLQRITHVVMDKTGTLTHGIMTVGDMGLNSRWKDKEDKLAVLICAAEEHGMSAHPFAMAIFRRLLPMTGSLWKLYQSYGGARELEESGGRGVRCEVDDGDGQWRMVCVGNLAWMRENEVKGLDPLPLDFETEGSACFVGVDGELAASMILQDVVRTDAKETIDALKARGIEISMLTGDQRAEACRISQQLGIRVLDSAATPDVKLKHIKALQQKGHKVLMVGDGMNDGPSLATADVGVMMANGKKCLTSGGSVLLLQPQLHALIAVLDISSMTMRQVSANIAWVIAYNVIAVALAVGVGEPYNISVSPPVAAAMMSFSSLFVTLQGLLLRTRLAKHTEREKL